MDDLRFVQLPVRMVLNIFYLGPANREVGCFHTSGELIGLPLPPFRINDQGQTFVKGQLGYQRGVLNLASQLVGHAGQPHGSEDGIGTLAQHDQTPPFSLR